MTPKRPLPKTPVGKPAEERISLEISKALKEAYDTGAAESLPADLQALVDRIANQGSGR